MINTMAASVQIGTDRFRLLHLVWSRRPPLPAPTLLKRAHEPRLFPQANSIPRLSAVLSDAVLEHYAFTFCQGGFHGLGMTFEQFLLVAEAVKPHDQEDFHHYFLNR